LDIKDDHIPNDGHGAVLTDLNEVKQYVQREWHEYNACAQHYERLYQIVEVLEVHPDDHIAEYKKLNEAEEQQRKKTDSDPNKDGRKRKAL
jgi:acetoin utilization deacetylase AcuC-like enzyme